MKAIEKNEAEEEERMKRKRGEKIKKKDWENKHGSYQER